MIKFDVQNCEANPVYLNGNKLAEFVATDYRGALYVFTSQKYARRWAEQTNEHYEGLDEVLPNP